MGRHHATFGRLYTLQQRSRRPLGLAGRRRDLRKTKDDCHARRHAPQCTSYSIRPLHPRDSRGNDDFHVPLRMYIVPPCDYKRRRRASFKGDVAIIVIRSVPLSTRYWHSPQSTPPLAETWELPSLSRHACNPLLQAPPVQDNTVPSHTPLLDVRPRGRNQDKPVRYYVASCINIWDEETRSIY